ncbi:MAG TPA: hypothetical protein VEX86_22650 [Longimicrobium sp.]|nr:hypothetical protein [Longimicrobium sp.]
MSDKNTEPRNAADEALTDEGLESVSGGVYDDGNGGCIPKFPVPTIEIPLY